MLDELESALSFAGQLALVRIVLEGAADGGQFVIATHSPIMMSTPGALVYEVDDLGIHQREAADPDVVLQWRSFAQCTERFLRFLER